MRPNFEELGSTKLGACATETIWNLRGACFSPLSREELGPPRSQFFPEREALTLRRGLP